MMKTLPNEWKKAAIEAAEKLDKAGPEEIIRWAVDLLGDKLVLSSSFGADSSALLHLTSQIAPKTRVAFLDTGWHFDETLDYRREIAEKLNLNVVDLVTEGGHDHFKAEFGELWRTDTDKCCHLNKTEPWRKFLINEGVAGWMAGIRRESGGLRAQIKVVELATVMDDDGQPQEFIKIHPMANWEKKTIWTHIFKYELPYNKLADDDGYKSIGCWPCTRRVGEGEDERAGRWSGSAKTECGLHTMSAPIAVSEEWEEGDAEPSS
jgi:phosphoadenosine phosphosulfate reductase